MLFGAQEMYTASLCIQSTQLGYTIALAAYILEPLNTGHHWKPKLCPL